MRDSAKVPVVTWHEIYSTKVEQCIAFYQKTMGWECRDSGMPDMDYQMFFDGDEPVAGVLDAKYLPEGATSLWLTYLGCSDVDKTLEIAKGLGAIVVDGPMDIPGVGRVVTIKDASGALVSLHQPSAT